MSFTSNMAAALRRLPAVLTTAVLLAALFALPGCGDGSEAAIVIEHDPRQPLSFGVLPFLQRDALDRTLGPLMGYLSGGLGRPVRLRVARTYAELERLLTQQRLDLGWFAPGTGRPADGSPQAVAVCVPTGLGGSPYHGLIVARNSTPPPTLASLAGKRFLYVDPNSRSGFLYPNRLLASRGIDPLRHFASIGYAGSHDRVIERLLAGDAEAGALSDASLRDPRRAALFGRELTVLARTEPILQDPIVAAAVLEPALREQVRTLFLELPSRPGGAAVLAGLRSALGVEGFR
jgi:phosphate/phosphite/phosphonate ABC transporter binding protein